MAEEEVLFEHGTVARVTTARAVFYGVTYVIAQVTSVRTLVMDPSRMPGLIVMLAGLAVGQVLFCGADGDMKLVLVAIAPALVGVMLGGMYIRSLRPKYAVIVSTAGAEKKAFVTSKKDIAKAAEAAITEAIVRRG